jgi:hypothetical protein
LVFLWSFKIDFYRFGMFYQEKSGSPGCEGWMLWSQFFVDLGDFSSKQLANIFEKRIAIFYFCDLDPRSQSYICTIAAFTTTAFALWQPIQSAFDST